MKIYTFAATRPDFIELQLRTFRKYLQEPFSFTVFNNAVFPDKHPYYREEVDRVCHELGIPVIDVQKDPELTTRLANQESDYQIFSLGGAYANPNVACAYPLCWAWENFIAQEKEPVCFLDSDLFLTGPVRLSEYLERYDMVFVPQFRVGAKEYMWNVLFLANPSKLPDPRSINWYCGKINNVPVDVGGQTYRYLETHPELKALRVGARHIDDSDPGADFHPADYEIFYFEDEPKMLHYRSGSNWNYRSNEYHEKKTTWLKKTIGEN
jgi:hypothetical protein